MVYIYENFSMSRNHPFESGEWLYLSHVTILNSDTIDAGRETPTLLLMNKEETTVFTMQ